MSVPDGVALGRDGGFYIACYRPDVIYRFHVDDGLSVLAEDRRGTVISAPTNTVFAGPGLDVMVVPNLGRWHLTRICAGVQDLPLNYPSAEQLGG